MPNKPKYCEMLQQISKKKETKTTFTMSYITKYYLLSIITYLLIIIIQNFTYIWNIINIMIILMIVHLIW